MHCKDIPPHRGGKRDAPGEKFGEPGTGALDLPGVIKALEEMCYEGWIVVERDSREPDDVLSARNMRAVLRRFGVWRRTLSAAPRLTMHARRYVALHRFRS